SSCKDSDRTMNILAVSLVKQVAPLGSMKFLLRFFLCCSKRASFPLLCRRLRDLSFGNKHKLVIIPFCDGCGCSLALEGRAENNILFLGGLCWWKTLGFIRRYTWLHPSVP